MRSTRCVKGAWNRRSSATRVPRQGVVKATATPCWRTPNLPPNRGTRPFPTTPLVDHAFGNEHSRAFPFVPNHHQRCDLQRYQKTKPFPAPLGTKDMNVSNVPAYI